MDKIEELKGSNMSANKSSIENCDDSSVDDTKRESSRIPFQSAPKSTEKDKDTLIIDRT